ncbi:MAG TPA: hypothetical protein VFF06_29555 [Polyangia bacterium]|nr:hypothetical protein [Polyangia bacterium]
MRAIVLAIALLFGAAASAQPRGAHSMKGWELYSWRADGRWYFSLVEGTNREKSLEEITGAKIDGVAQLEQKLTLLQVGEEIAWGTGSHVRTKRGVFAAPPDPIRERILTRCAKLGLKVEPRN